MGAHPDRRLLVALQKELEQLEKRERRLKRSAEKQEPPEWKEGTGDKSA